MQNMNRRQFLGMAVAGICAGVGAMSWQAAAKPGDAGKRMNVLHLISDDLRACMGCYGDPMIQTPNIDRLASRGVRFEHAYCQFPLCNPSRASFMTGLRPDTIRVWDNQVNFRDTTPDAVTIAQSFQQAGYSVARVGKIYHYGVPRGIGTSGLDDPASWEQFVNPRGRDMDDVPIIEVLALGADGRATTVMGKQPQDMGGTLSWLAADGTDRDQTDGIGAVEAVKLLEQYSAHDKPFYLAVGFYRPHTPYVAPKAYYEKYPLEEIKVPKVAENLNDLFPAPALSAQKAVHLAMDDELKRRALQAYAAATTFMDAQVGYVVDALERLGMADNTIIVFHSDHGYHLGEKNLWQKMSIFEESARVPMIVHVPGNEANGATCTRPVELVSLHKTLTDLAEVKSSAKPDGPSFAALVKKPDARWRHAAYSQVNRGGIPGVTRAANSPAPSGANNWKEPIWGRSVRTERWRYTEWDDGRAGAELYDHDADPLEMKNLAEDPGHAREVKKLKRILSKVRK